MITTPAILIIFGGLSGVLGHLMAPRVAGFSPQPTVWLDRRLITATTSVAGAAAMCLASNWPELISFTLLGIGCGLLVLIDVATFRLPDVIVGPLYLIMIAGLLLEAALGDEWRRMITSLIIGSAVILCYFVLGLVTRRLGSGDVKLAGVLGLFLGWLGWPQTALGILAGFAVGAVVALLLLAGRRASVGSEFPFGPCMIIGAAVGVLLGPTVFPALG